MRRQWLYASVLLSVTLGAWSAVGAGEPPPDVTFKLGDVVGAPGATGVPVYLSIASDTPLNAARMAFTYDKTILTAESMECYFGAEEEYWEFFAFQLWTPSDPAITRHGCLWAFISDLYQKVMYLPVEGEPIGCARFAIAADAPLGTETALTFEDNVVIDSGNLVTNLVIFSCLPGCIPDVAPSFEDGAVSVGKFANGRVRILEEISIIFMRGDANLDRKVNIADAIATLGYLFRAGPSLSCPDAADANDDGVLDIADPIVILYTLFGNASTIAAPYPSIGQDPTMDFLGVCRY